MYLKKLESWPGNALFSCKMFCFIAINRSSEFASRPGACPMKIGEAVKSSCVSDMDCPGYKKCCKTFTGTHCSDPVPEGIVVQYCHATYSFLLRM